jgi:chemotaxis receptor (MCP) glutamine deamidase CheD
MDYQKLEATLAGEGIKTNTAHEKSGIIRPILNQYEIPIIGEDLGYIGLKGRLIFLHCETGLVEVFRA